MSYHFSPEQVADYSEPICLDGSQPGQLSSKSTPAECLSSDSGTASCPDSPSGIWTLENLTDESLQSISRWLTSLSLAPDSPANHSRPRGSNSEPTIQEICGQQRLTPFASYDREGSCWRTSQLSLLTSISELFRETWPKAGIVLDGDAYQLPRWERRISEIGFGGLAPTPRALEHGDYTYDSPSVKAGKHGLDLAGAVKLWPTPRSSPNENRQTKPTPSQLAGKHGKSLAAEVQMWSVSSSEDVIGQLNPDWVEWLMGWPIGWTSLEPLNRESFDLWMRSGTWWQADPADDGLVPRLAQCVPSRVARLKALGNGQVPAVVRDVVKLLGGAK